MRIRPRLRGSAPPRQRLTSGELQPNVVRGAQRQSDVLTGLVMEPLLPWMIALVLLVVALIGAVAWRLTRERKPQIKPLPTEWSLAPRPVFSTDERRVYRQLREA